ncbi:hypothetical protein NDU88_002882 [Pleurodeles waltl]|uniref:Uncharacterized protein n=1 Tax=Pleurodeles waltl TaxID=8319 RepID=A0AAV7QAM0_PLEWA|nr:hypothetical protein NDU88_002882 [Pleurodeles waltl]
MPRKAGWWRTNRVTRSRTADARSHGSARDDNENTPDELGNLAGTLKTSRRVCIYLQDCGCIYVIWISASSYEHLMTQHTQQYR